MLTPLCLLACLCAADPDPYFPPASAEAALFRARFAMIEKTAPVQASFYPPKTGCREAFYALPVARVNDVVLTAGQVLFRWIPYLETAAQNGVLSIPGKTTEEEAAAMNRSREGGRPYQAGPQSIALTILLSELPRCIETELFWQAAQRDWDRERFGQVVVRLESEFDNREILNLGRADTAAALFEKAGITLLDFRSVYVHQLMAWQYVSRIPTDSIDAQSAIKKAAAEEWNKADIQTAFDLPVRK